MLQFQEPTKNSTSEENANKGVEMEDQITDQAEPIVRKPLLLCMML